MRKILLPLVLSILAAGPVAVTASVAATPSHTNQTCFYPDQVRGFTQTPDNAMNLRVGAKDVYHLTFAGVCENLKWARAISLEGGPGGPSLKICEGMGVTVVTEDDRCFVNSIRRLSPEEIAALPSSERP
jgi:hypothetical protein